MVQRDVAEAAAESHGRLDGAGEEARGAALQRWRHQDGEEEGGPRAQGPPRLGWNEPAGWGPCWAATVGPPWALQEVQAAPEARVGEGEASSAPAEGAHRVRGVQVVHGEERAAQPAARGEGEGAPVEGGSTAKELELVVVVERAEVQLVQVEAEAELAARATAWGEGGVLAAPVRCDPEVGEPPAPAEELAQCESGLTLPAAEEARGMGLVVRAVAGAGPEGSESARRVVDGARGGPSAKERGERVVGRAAWVGRVQHRESEGALQVRRLGRLRTSVLRRLRTHETRGRQSS